MVTYNRPGTALATLQAVFDQSMPPMQIFVVDNGDVDRLDEVDLGPYGSTVRVFRPPANLGPAGGFAHALERVLPTLHDDDLVLLVDDDDPPPVDGLIESLVELIEAEGARRDLGGVGLSGGVFDWKRGSWRRLEPGARAGPIQVDYLNGGYLPIYSARALRKARPFDPQLFWGFEELDGGLTLRRAGFTLLMHSTLWAETAPHYPKVAARGRPRYGVRAPTWRRYCGTRNQVYILRKHGYRRQLVLNLLPRLVLKYAANLPTRPRVTVRAAMCDLRAVKDGWSSSGMGRSPNLAEYRARRPAPNIDAG